MRRKYERKVPTKGYNDRVRINYDRKQPTFEYMKYFRVVRYWVKRTHGVGLADLEMMMFLHSERLFTKTKFAEFEEIMTWDVTRFERLKREGWINIWRKGKKAEATLYELSFKGKALVNTVYKKLSGEQPIAETAGNNPIFKKNPPYTDKVYKRAIVKMNNETKEQRQRLAPE